MVFFAKPPSHLFQASASWLAAIRFHVQIQYNKNKTIQSSQAPVDNKPCLCLCLDRARPGWKALAEYYSVPTLKSRERQERELQYQAGKQASRHESMQERKPTAGPNGITQWGGKLAHRHATRQAGEEGAKARWEAERLTPFLEPLSPPSAPPPMPSTTCANRSSGARPIAQLSS